MREYLKFYIDGQWVDPVEPKTANVINPATAEVSGVISVGSWSLIAPPDPRRGAAGGARRRPAQRPPPPPPPPEG